MSPNHITDPLLHDKQYHLATIARNERTTAADWYQDVRSFEFVFEEDIQYVFILSFLPSES